jgi:recombination protein RecA
MDEAPVKKKRRVVEEVEEEPEVSEVHAVDVNSVQRDIKKLLHYSTFEPDQTFWLNVDPELNSVLGSKEFGIPYGKLIELSGLEHGGKTTMTTYLAGLAQQEGAGVIYLDLERSRDPVWAAKLGLDFSQVIPIYSKLMMRKKKKKKGKDSDEDEGEDSGLAQLQTAEELFSEAAITMELLRQKGFEKQFLIIDSVAMISTKDVLEAGIQGQNMRTRMGRSMFLSETLPVMTQMAANYNAMIFLINQIRMKPGVMFGDPSYTPGGKGLDHAADIKARIRRLKDGRILHGGKAIGLLGKIKNHKNKGGRGSYEFGECGFKILWNKEKARVRFMTVEEADDILPAKAKT